jgi:two-component system, NarL family, nitrate/nitrite response regulator NarL
MSTSVLIVDDHPMIRSAVALLLEGTGFRVAASADNAQSALDRIQLDNPDIVILDLAMPEGSGLDVLRKIRTQGDKRPVIILTAAIDDHRLASALALSANGIVMKNSDPAHLLDCLEAVRSGASWIDPDLRDRAAAASERGAPERLAPREQEIVALVSQGLRNRDIASQLGITEGTVKVYLHAIFEKLGVSSRTELAIQSAERPPT